MASLEKNSPLAKFYITFTNSLKLKLETKLVAEQKAKDRVEQLIEKEIKDREQPRIKKSREQSRIKKSREQLRMKKGRGQLRMKKGRGQLRMKKSRDQP